MVEKQNFVAAVSNLFRFISTFVLCLTSVLIHRYDCCLPAYATSHGTIRHQTFRIYSCFIELLILLDELSQACEDLQLSTIVMNTHMKID